MEKVTDTAISNPVLSRLSVFVGAWQWEATVGGQLIGRGSTVFAWLEDGAFLIEHAGSESPDFPSGITIISGDDTLETYCMLQGDSRSMSRIYQMSLRDGVWKLWREAPGFWQRFTGTFSEDGKTIRGRWESSSDGSQWELDFDLTYTKN
jgi:hypothetical protein